MCEMGENFTRLGFHYPSYDMPESKVYAIFALRNGVFGANSKITQIKFRYAILLKPTGVELVKKWTDQVLVKFKIEEFRTLVDAWPKVQSVGLAGDFEYNPKIERRCPSGAVISVWSNFAKDQHYPKVQIKGTNFSTETGIPQIINLSHAEIMGNSKEDLDRIVYRWYELKEEGFLHPKALNMGPGNPYKKDEEEKEPEGGAPPKAKKTKATVPATSTAAVPHPSPSVAGAGYTALDGGNNSSDDEGVIIPASQAKKSKRLVVVIPKLPLPKPRGEREPDRQEMDAACEADDCADTE